LCNKGLNPKTDLKHKHASQQDIEEVFGECSSYGTTDLQLLEMREEMLALYMKVYGSFMATNNEFMKWFVKGYIAKKT